MGAAVITATVLVLYVSTTFLELVVATLTPQSQGDTHHACFKG